MSEEKILARLIVDFYRPHLEASMLVLNSLKANAEFLKEKAAASEDPISASILTIAAKKMASDVELEIAARN